MPSSLIRLSIKFLNFLFLLNIIILFQTIRSDAEVFKIVANENNFDKYFYGKAIITDGDSLKIFNKRVRLLGIDAPEMKQQCKDIIDRQYYCGKVSKNALINKISAQKVHCHYKNFDKYGRAISVCWVQNTNLNYWLVYNGYAVA